MNTCVNSRPLEACSVMRCTASGLQTVEKDITGLQEVIHRKDMAT